MALTKRAILFTLLITLACAVFSQNSISLEAEIQNMEKTANKQDIPPERKRETFVRLARLKQLSGDIEGAAKNWLEAAAAVPGNIDDDALLACAVCLAAMGEWDRASAALEPLLPKLQRARFLDTGIKAIQSGDISALAALANNPQFSKMKSEIYFMLWKISKGQAAESWRGKLLAEYPQSPEGRMAAGDSSSTIIVRPSPFWLFASGMDSLPLSAETYTMAKPSSSLTAVSQNPVPAASVPVQKSAQIVSQANAPQSVIAQKSTPSVQPQNPTPQASAPAQAAVPPTGVKLQTGIYSKQANADTQMDKLRKAGFTPFLEKRDDKWAVMVPASSDQGRTIKELREAGFESFPVK